MIKICLAIAALSAVSLSGCSSVTSNSEGYILTYTYNGKELSISTREIIDRYLNENRNDHAAAFYNALNEVVIRRAFEEDGPLASFKSTVDNNATNDVNYAKDQADEDGTSWSDYLDGQITDDSLTTEEKEQEFFLQKQYERMKTTVEEQYFENFSDYQKDSSDSTADLQDEYNLLYGTNGYIQNKVPYHIRHILVQVDASQDYGYSRGHISSDDAHQIYQVVTALVNGTSFADTANLYTDDTGNEDSSTGTLNGGEYIMDSSTSFVNEFKLGIYTYDLLLSDNGYESDTNYKTKLDNLHIPGSVKDTLTDFGVSWIPYDIILELERVKDQTTANGVTVNDNDEDYYPRNIYFNKYFQNRNVAFITDEALLTDNQLGYTTKDYSSFTGDNWTTVGMDKRNDKVSGNTVYSDVNEEGHYITSGVQSTNLDDTQKDNFQEITIDGVTKNVLCDQNGNPIMVVRNQESSSGIHFIVIERSAFDTAGGTAEDEPYKATIEEYYAPVTPKEIDGIDPNTQRPYWTTDGTFPVYTDNGVTLPKQTYVQTEEVRSYSDVNNTVGNYSTRVSTLRTSIETSIDTYDTFKWLNPDYEISLNDIAGQDIQSMVETYINKETRASEDTAAQSLEDSWMSYANSIVQQNRQRQYMLLPEVLARHFGEANLYVQGAPGYNAKYDNINSSTGSGSSQNN